MKKVEIHGDGEVGVDVTDNRCVTWSKGDNSVKTWPNGITNEPHTLDMLGNLLDLIRLDTRLNIQEK